jgi:hypothetical protein
MTDLTQAIAELRTYDASRPWAVAPDLADDPVHGPAAKAIATIIQAALSGELIPATERDAAVALLDRADQTIMENVPDYLFEGREPEQLVADIRAAIGGVE